MHRLTLRVKFTLIIAAVLLTAVVAVLFVFSGTTSRIIHEFALRVATRQALHDRNKILALIDREVALSLKLADDAVIRAWMSRPDPDRQQQEAAFRQLDSYRRFFRDQSYFVAKKNGNRYFNADRTVRPGQPRTSLLRPENPSDAWFYSTLNRVDSFELNLNYDKLINQIKLWVNVIIYDGQGNKIGIGGTGIGLSEFLRDIVHSGEAGTSAILIDRRGIVQAHQDQKLVEKNALEQDPDKRTTIYHLLSRPEDRLVVKDALAALADGRVAVTSFPLRIAGRQVVAAVTFMPAIGWYTIAVVDAAHALQQQAFLPLILVSISTLLAAIILIAILINRLVLKPLQLLTEASGEMSRGNYAIVLPVARQDEIGQLTASFNGMAATINDHMANLEERVRQRTEELSVANQRLEASQADILESLMYARVIQASILPDQQLLEIVFQEWFALYQPCAIVGGDLYWLRQTADGRLLLAVLDCTGHGVPGAFMTMTVNAVLNTIVDTVCNDDPARILQEVNRLLQQTLRLRQDDDSLVDAGLDIGLCCIDPAARSLSFAGAGISLWLVCAGTLEEIRADHRRVGYRSSDQGYLWHTHYRTLQHDTRCYMTTDGFLDEGGGAKGYGFGNARFSAMVEGHQTLPLSEQKTAFADELAHWRGARQQRDDILVVGFRL